MVRGSRVGYPLLVSFFLFFFCFPFCSSSPTCASLAWDGVEGFTLCASISFLLFVLFTFTFLFFLSLLFFFVVLLLLYSSLRILVAGLRFSSHGLDLRLLLHTRLTCAAIRGVGERLTSYLSDFLGCGGG